MARKKVLEDGVYTYQAKVVKAFSPTQWGVGEWVKNKEAIGGYEFTGEVKSELLGYQLVMMVYCNNEVIGVCERLSEKIYKTEEEAKDRLNDYLAGNAGVMFNPASTQYKIGMIVA